MGTLARARPNFGRSSNQHPHSRPQIQRLGGATTSATGVKGHLASNRATEFTVRTCARRPLAARGASVLDSRLMGEAEDDRVVEWRPEPPAECPLDGAVPAEGTFARLVNDTRQDWTCMAVLNGQAWYDGLDQRSKALSIGLSLYGSGERAEAARTGITSLARRQPPLRTVVFDMSEDMGDTMLTKPPSHFTWWTHHVDFDPPPKWRELE